MTRLRKNSFAALGILALATAIALPVLASAHSASGSGPAGGMGMGMGAGQGMMQGMMGTMSGTPGATARNGMPGPGMMKNMQQMHDKMQGMMANGMSGNGPMQGCPGATPEDDSGAGNE